MMADDTTTKLLAFQILSKEIKQNQSNLSLIIENRLQLNINLHNHTTLRNIASLLNTGGHL